MSMTALNRENERGKKEEEVRIHIPPFIQSLRGSDHMVPLRGGAKAARNGPLSAFAGVSVCMPRPCTACAAIRPDDSWQW